MSDSFKNAIKRTLQDNSIWREIFAQYGTHLVHKINFGGRIRCLYKISKKEYLELKALDVDLKLASSYKMQTDPIYDEKKLELFKKINRI